ncbi:hypothetical protein U0070_019617 [Myodes glareolus]|uniref:Uncharacterized protein n=1 Tax=Myodes glareolus TaxID=447135 RepID=A0AAW0JL81_MYOGA
MPLARQLLLKMRLWELLPFLVPFIFLWGIQEPELAEGFFMRSYLCAEEQPPGSLQTVKQGDFILIS